MFRAMLEDRQRREEEIAEERRRYTEESERRMDDMRKQMECLQKIVTEHSTGSAPPRERSGTEAVKLTRLADNDDIEAYLTTFERVMLAHEVCKDRWPYQLAPQLTGKAQQAYAALPPDEAKTCEAIKEAILRRYDITAETYRQRFRNLRPKEGETPQELVTRLKDLGSRWTSDSKTREELLDLMVKEQFLEILPEDARIAVIDRQPKDSDEAARIAGNYLQARSMTMTWKNRKAPVPTTKCPKCGNYGHWAKDCTTPEGSQEKDADRRHRTGNLRRPLHPLKDARPNYPAPKCYNCNERGHISSNCPKRSLFCGKSRRATSEEDRACRRGTVNGVYCRDILLDTGATQTLVHKDLVTDDDVLDGEVTVRCAHNDTTSYPLAVIKVNIGGRDIITTAAVSSTLPASILLGWDVPDLLKLVKDEMPYQEKTTKEKALAVMTRSRQQQQDRESSLSKDPDMDSNTAEPLQPEPVENNTENPQQEQPIIEQEDQPEAITDQGLPEDQLQDEFNFDDTLFSPPGSTKIPLTRAQKRNNRRRYWGNNETNPIEPEALDVTVQELQKLQETDESLERPRSFTFGGSGGISSAAGVWMEPTVHRPVDSAWIETCVTEDRASGATTAASVPGARPARRDVPQGADGPSHPYRVGRTVASCASCRHSHEDRRGYQQLCEVDSCGQPAPRERVERGRTPGVSDKEGHGGADGAWTPPPAGPGSGQSGDRGSWANTALDSH